MYALMYPILYIASIHCHIPLSTATSMPVCSVCIILWHDHVNGEIKALKKIPVHPRWSWTFYYPRTVLAFRYCRCLRLSDCPCVRVSQTLAGPRDNSGPFKLGSPNLDQRCKIPWSRSLLSKWRVYKTNSRHAYCKNNIQCDFIKIYGCLSSNMHPDSRVLTPQFCKV